MDDTIRIIPIGSRDYGQAASIPTGSEIQDIAVSHKDHKLVFVVTLTSVLVIRDGKIVNKHDVKYSPSSLALSIDETMLAVGGKVIIILTLGKR